MIRDVLQHGIIAMISEGQRFGRAYLDYNVKQYNENKIMMYNPNTVGYYVVTVFPALLLMLEYERDRLYRIMYQVFIFIVLFFGFLSLSRTFVLTLAIICVFYVLWTAKNIKKFVNLTLAIIAIILVLLLIIPNQYLQLLIDAFSTRFEAESDSITGNRLEIILEYIAAMNNKPWTYLFGVGMQDYRAKFGIQLMMVHNSIFEIIIMWGFLGLLLFCIWLITVWNNVYGQGTNAKNKKALLPLLGFVIFSQSQQFLSGYYQHLPIFLFCMFVIKYNPANSRSVIMRDAT